MVGDKVLLRHTIFKGKHKIQDNWETLYMLLWNNHLKKYQFSKSNHMGGDDRVKMVHRNLSLPLFSYPLDCAGELDNGMSLVNPKETMDTQVAAAVSAIPSHVHSPSAYEGAQTCSKGDCSLL